MEQTLRYTKNIRNVTKDRQICNKTASENMPDLAIILIRDSKTLPYSSKETVIFLTNSVGIKFSKLEAGERGFSRYKNKNRDFLQKCITLDILFRNLKRNMITKFYKLVRKLMI